MPPSPVAVIVYVVVAAGDTERLPLKATLPIPGAIEQLSARVESHDRVSDSPERISRVEADKLTVGGCGVGSGGSEGAGSGVGSGGSEGVVSGAGMGSETVENVAVYSDSIVLPARSYTS